MGSEGYRHESGMGMGTAWAQVPVGYEYGLVLLEVVPAGSHEHRAGALTCNSSPSFFSLVSSCVTLRLRNWASCSSAFLFLIADAHSAYAGVLHRDIFVDLWLKNVLNDQSKNHAASTLHDAKVTVSSETLCSKADVLSAHCSFEPCASRLSEWGL